MESWPPPCSAAPNATNTDPSALLRPGRWLPRCWRRSPRAAALVPSARCHGNQDFRLRRTCGARTPALHTIGGMTSRLRLLGACALLTALACGGCLKRTRETVDLDPDGTVTAA